MLEVTILLSSPKALWVELERISMTSFKPQESVKSGLTSKGKYMVLLHIFSLSLQI